MTITEIENFIDERIAWCEVVQKNGLHFNAGVVKNNFEMILDMLKELGEDNDD